MKLRRQEISDAVGGLGWRYILGTLATSVRAGSVAEAAAVVSTAAAACGADADGHFWAGVRADRALLTLQDLESGYPTQLDLDLATRISSAVAALGLATVPEVASESEAARAVQLIEVGLDALDIPAVRPFWKAILGYVDEPGRHGPTDPLVDPYRHGPALWFQQMDVARTQRNRIHLDISVPHDEAARRMAAALAAGGKLVYEAEAPAFWVLADAEGNEACITTWQGRD